MGLFDILSLFYAFLGVRAVWTLIQNWKSFTDNELTPSDRRLASEISFFLFVPIGVFLHELGHAAATYTSGGTIDWFNGGFHYALFYGYVISVGRFTVLQDWWISLAGNLVSIVYGFAPLLFLRFTDKGWIKYTILAFARFQLGWSLVGYPLITFAGFEGDWTTIYFAIPLLGAITFIAQAALVGILFFIDRSATVKRWEVSLYAGGSKELEQLDAAIQARPGIADPIIARGNYFAAHGLMDMAIADYRAVLKMDAENPRALYNIGQIRLMQKKYTDAEKQFRAAMMRTGSDSQLAARVHFGLGLCLYYRNGAAKALPEFDAAISLDATASGFFYWRGTARKALGDDVNAQSDFARVDELTKSTMRGTYV